MSAAHWHIGISCSLVNWYQLTNHWPNNFSFSLANWCQLHIGHLRSDPHLSTDISCSLVNLYQLLIAQLLFPAHWLTVVVSCLTANQCQLLIDHLVDHWATKVTCMLANLHQLLISRLMPAAHWPSYISCSLANITSAAHWQADISFSLANLHQLLIGQPMLAGLWQTEMLICKPNATNIKFNSKPLKLCLPRRNAAGRLLWVSYTIPLTANIQRELLRWYWWYLKWAATWRILANESWKCMEVSAVMNLKPDPGGFTQRYIHWTRQTIPPGLRPITAADRLTWPEPTNDSRVVTADREI